MYEVNISFDGDKIEQVKGLKAEAMAYADIKGLAVYTEVAVYYTYNDLPISAELRAWYNYDKTTNGEVVLCLDKLNGTEVSVTVSAEINKTVEAVKELLNYCNVQLDMPSMGGNVQLENVLTSVLSADLSTLIPELATTTDGLKLGVNADEVIKLFNVEIPLTIGTVNLAYSHSNCNLTASVPALGLEVTISGKQGEIEQPNKDNCLDLAALIETVNSAWAQINGIIENEAVSFKIIQGQTYLNLDGITVGLWGEVEVSWKEGGEYVALDLGMAIEENGSDVSHLKALYQKNAEGQPLVRLALNGVGIDIYPEDIQTVTDGFDRIYNKIVTALGNGSDENANVSPEGVESANENGADNEENGFDFASLKSNDKLMTLIFKVLSSGEWVDVLNDMTLTADAQVIEDGEAKTVKRSLTLAYAADNAAEIRVSTNGNISLFYNAAVGKRFTFGGELQACAASGALVKSLNAQFESINMSSSKKEGSAGFVRLAYEYLFEALSSVSVKNILGSDTYEVKFLLNGDNCNIEALSGVLIEASVYVTGENNESGKLAEADLKLNVAGVVVDLNVISERVGSQTYFYINLRQVDNFKLPDLKVVATQSSLYETISVLLSAINDTKAMDLIGSLISSDNKEEKAEQPQTAPVAKPDGEIINQSKLDKIADLIEKILNFKFGEAIEATEADGVTTAVLNLDNVVKQFDIECEILGTVEITINHKYHSMKTSGKAYVTNAEGVSELKEWIALSSEKTQRRDYSAVDKTKYISIEFIPSLLRDLVKFATDDAGNIYEMFTFSGVIDVNLVNFIKVKLEVSTLTVGFGENTGFYFSLIANLSGGMVTNNTIGITYQNGYLTLGRKLSTSSPEYKIMTFEYFIDNLFAKGSSSTLNWLLGVSNTVWNTLIGMLGDLVKMDSGLTTPEDIFLYKAQENKTEQEISMYDYVNALRVIVNGRQTANIGDVSKLEDTLGVHDNYYGFDLNAGLFTNNVITSLYAAITRDDETGINGIKAYGAIQSYVTFNVSLGYEEGLTEENYFNIGDKLEGGVSAPSLFVKSETMAEAAGVEIDYEHFVKMQDKGYDEQFGSFSTADMSTDYSHVLYSHKLTIHSLDGSVTERSVRHGSTIYLYDNASPVYTDGSKNFRIAYSLESGGEVIGASIVLNGDLQLYEVARKAVNVIIANGSEEAVITSFAGAYVPINIDGLDTIEGPFYEDGTSVSAADLIPDGIDVLKLHGTFVQSEVIINYVKYTFNAQTKSYEAGGKAAGFNDYYSVNGNTLVLENEINGYKVTKISNSAFANTDDKPIKNVVVPSNITVVGENAFLDNKEMESAVFLADSVYFEGSDGNGTYAFFGCSTSENEEKTNLKIYINEAACADGGTYWTNFSKKAVIGINYFKYVGNDPKTNETIDYHANGGGELHAKGSWQNVNYKVSVQSDGISDGEAMQKAIEDILAPYFPAIIIGEFVGSAEELNVQKALEAACTQFDIVRNDILYKCVFTSVAEQSGCNVVVNYHITYTAACTINVYSPVAFTYYGVEIKANTLTTVNIPVEGDTVNLADPEDKTHVFLGWQEENVEGVNVHTAIWRDKVQYTVKVVLGKSILNQSMLYVGNQSQKAARNKTATLEFKVYEGNVTFTLKDNVLTVDDGVNVTLIYANEINGLGRETDTKRGISSDVTGERVVGGSFTINITY